MGSDPTGHNFGAWHHGWHRAWHRYLEKMHYKDKFTQKESFDIWLFILTLALVALGIIMVFSASSVFAGGSKECNFDSYYFFKRQVLWILISFLGMFLAAKINLNKLRKYNLLILAGSAILLVLVLIPGIGYKVFQARRWLVLGPLSFQPSEMAKLALILYLADLGDRYRDKFKEPLRLIPALIVLGVLCFLIEKEPDLGTVIVVGAVFFAMIFLAGVKFRYILGLTTVGMVFVVFRIFRERYRIRRLTAFFNPWRDPQDAGYNVIQSLISLGSGGVFGLGLGQSRQKFFYLPERHTDFIFAILGEELGLAGTLLVIFLFLTLLYRGFKIATQAPDPYLRLLAAGITFMIAFQAFLNMGVVTAILPATGIPLPFISFGGSSLLFSLLGIGILLNISKQSRFE